MLTNAPITATVPCIDLAAARAFYGETLGLTEVERPGTEDAEMAFYQCGQGTQLAVYQRSTPSKADHTVAAWMVEDFDATADSLISSSVTFIVYEDMPDVEWDDRGVANFAGLKTAWFADPDGNILSIAKMP